MQRVGGGLWKAGRACQRDRGLTSFFLHPFRTRHSVCSCIFGALRDLFLKCLKSLRDSHPWRPVFRVPAGVTVLACGDARGRPARRCHRPRVRRVSPLHGSRHVRWQRADAETSPHDAWHVFFLYSFFGLSLVFSI